MLQHVTSFLLTTLACSAPLYADVLHDFVVKLNFSRTEVEDAEATRIRFPGGQTFSCSIGGDAASRRIPGRGDDLVVKAKSLAISPRCHHYRFPTEYWSYELCPGKEASQFRVDGSTTSSKHVPKTLIGSFVEGSRRVLGNGTIEERYDGGAANRAATVHYVCARTTDTFIEITEPEIHQYRFVLGHPAACSTYTLDDGTYVYDEFEDEGPFDKLSDVPEAREGSVTIDRLISLDYGRKSRSLYGGSTATSSSGCSNFTIGYWSYRYCYPHVLWQYHVSSATGEIEGRPHLLGTITNGSRESLEADEESFVNRVPAFSLSSSASPFSESDHGRRWPKAVRHEVMYTLGNGSICHENNETRSVRVKLACPEDWEEWKSGKDPRVESLVEVALCRYILSISVPALCADLRMLPRKRNSAEDE
ncbi:hypothetical protein FOZ62_031024, partial [Perkinsus olseni]